MLAWLRAAYREQAALLAESEALRREQEAAGAAAPGAGADPSSAAAVAVAKADAAAVAAAKADAAAEAGREGGAEAATVDDSLSGLPALLLGAWPRRDLARLRNEFVDAPWHYSAPAALCSLGHALCEVTKGFALGRVTDALAGHLLAPPSPAAHAPAASAPAASAGAALAALVLVQLLEWGLAVARDYLFACARAERALSSRTRYMGALLRQDLAFHAHHRSAALAARLQSDPSAADEIVVFSLERLLRGCASLATIGAMLLLDARVTLLAIALRLPFILQAVERGAQLGAAYERLHRATRERAHARAAELLGSVKALQAAQAEGGELAGFARLLYSHLRVVRGSALARALLRHAEAAVLIATNLAVLAYGAHRIRAGDMTLGRFQALRATADLFTEHFHSLEALYNSLRAAALTSRRYYAARDREPAVQLSMPPTAEVVRAVVAEAEAAASGAKEVAYGGGAVDGFVEEAPLAVGAGAGLLLRRRRRRESDTAGAAPAPGPSPAPPARGLCLFAPPASASAGAPSDAAVAEVAALLARGPIAFEHVCFSYGAGAGPDEGPDVAPAVAARIAQRGAPGPAVARSGGVLSDVSFEIQAGSRVALVGPSGGGKSTCLLLLLRFADPTHGRVSIAGRDLRSLDARALRRCCGLVDQDCALLDRSVADNIALGCGLAGGGAGAADAAGEVEAAARAACAHDFISALPRGYASGVGERGARLSGGPRQRVALARAHARRPRLLLLDEATSALDAASEAAGRASLALRARGGGGGGAAMTTVLVTHRLAGLREGGADRVVVLDGGRVAEQGAPAALLRERPGGLFARLLRLQEQEVAPRQ